MDDDVRQALAALAALLDRGDAAAADAAGDTTTTTRATAAQPDANGDYPVRLVLAVEGHETSDRRLIAPGALSTRAFPQSLAAQLNPGHGGESGPSVLCGRLDSAERVPGPEVRSRETGQPFPEGTFVWRGQGVLFGTKGQDPEAGSALDLVLRGGLTGNSVDLNACEVELTFDAEDDAGVMPGQMPGETRNPDGSTTVTPPRPPLQRFTSATLGMTTLVPVPAFAEAYVEVGTGDGWEVITPADSMADVEPSPFITAHLPADDDGEEPQGAIVASAGAQLPSTAMFAEPTPEELPDGAAPRITAEGRVFGWVGMWDDCHTGYTDRCVPPPRSPSAYGRFHVGAVRARDDAGQELLVSTGPLTVGGGHAPVRLGQAAAVEHYDNVATCAAQVHVGENTRGIWYSGIVRPGADPALLFDVQAAPPSGDWRSSVRDHRPDMIGLHSVNTPGYRRERPSVEYAMADDGHCTALVAAGAIHPGTPTPSGAVMLDYDILAERIADRMRAGGVEVEYVRPDYAADDGGSSKVCNQKGCGKGATHTILTKGDGGPLFACGAHVQAVKDKAGDGATAKALADVEPTELELRRRRALALAGGASSHS